MRHRDLAVIAVTATVAATPGLATVMEDLTTAPPAAAQSFTGLVPITPSSCDLFSPSRDGNTVATEVDTFSFSKGGSAGVASSCELPGTLSLQASVDHSHWKTLAQTHGSVWSFGAPVTAQCRSGTWWYQGYFVADDGSFKGGTDRFATQFTC